MKSPEAVLRNALITSPIVGPIVGTRVHAQASPLPVTLPYITWRRAGIRRFQTLSGPMGVPQVTVDIDIFAVTYEAARDLADKCRMVLDGYSGSFDNTNVRHAWLENEQDDFVTLAGADMPPVYSVKLTFEVLWQEI